ncbi:MAG: hypothetical protein ACJA1A_003845 [Saprospiraceae bacterium]|jgi:hypothetical protein
MVGLVGYSQEMVDTIHTPKKATICSAVFPGAGQVYNQIYKLPEMKNNLWWKLPIVYGGLGYTSYLIAFNQGQFNYFHQERLNRLDASYVSPTSYSDSQLQTLQEQYRGWRDYAIIATVGVYLLQIVDAKVEAHLMHFDVSDDLSLDIGPFSSYAIVNRQPIGASLVFSFK